MTDKKTYETSRELFSTREGAWRIEARFGRIRAEFGRNRPSKADYEIALDILEMAGELGIAATVLMGGYVNNIYRDYHIEHHGKNETEVWWRNGVDEPRSKTFSLPRYAVAWVAERLGIKDQT